MEKCRKLLNNGKYSILSVISHGGFGITYTALRLLDNTVVCIKEFFNDSICKINPQTNYIEPITQKKVAIFDKFKASFIKEAQTLQKLECNNIVKVYDFFEENGTAYYVMEFIDGKPLSEIIPVNGIDIESDLTIFRPILATIKYLHQRRITHLDIKPSNILVRRNGEIVLIDFGGSKRYLADGEQTGSSPLSNSEGFAPIELYSEHTLDSFSPATDIYELGATLYNLVTGKVPPSASEIMDEGNPIENANIPYNIKKTILLAMEPSLKRRLSTVEEFELYLMETSDDDKTHTNAPLGMDDTIRTCDADDVLDDGAQRNNRSLRNLWMFITFGLFIIVITIFIVSSRKAEDQSADLDAGIIEDASSVVDSTIIMNELKQFVVEQNSKPHIVFAGGMSIDSLALTKRGLEYFISYSTEGKAIYDELKKCDLTTQKDYVLTGMKNDTQLIQICKKLIMLDLGLIWHYKYVSSSDSIILELSPSEISTLKKYEGSNAERRNQQFVEMAQNITKQCPREVEEGLYMVKCEFKQNRVIYYYNCLQNYYDYITSDVEGYKSELESLFNSDEAMKISCKMLAAEGINIQYVYKNISNGKITSIIYNPLIKKFLKNEV